MDKDYKGLAVVLSIIYIIVISMAVYSHFPLWSGVRVVLETQPIDPLHPIAGQYMIIRYNITSVDLQDSAKPGDTIYVCLEKGNSAVWENAGVSKSRPEGCVFIRGTVHAAYGDYAEVIYGIEEYYFERSREIPAENITVEAALSRTGRARIVRLLYNNEPLEIKHRAFDLRD